MEISKIVTLLTQFDNIEQLRTQATLLEYRGGGGSESWNCKAEDDFWYVVKCRNNPQDRSCAPRLKVVTTELICSRLGQLFVPPICPFGCIIDIPESLASAVVYSDGERPSAGPSFGSRLVKGVVDTKYSGIINLVPPEQAARVIVFQTWLQGQDTAALVSDDGNGRMYLSIDHGYYLTGPQWDETVLTTQPTVSLVLPPRFQELAKLEDAQLFRGVLDELINLSEMEIIKSLAGIPQEWGASVEFRAKLTDFVLKRRSLVEQAVSILWRGAA